MANPSTSQQVNICGLGYQMQVAEGMVVFTYAHSTPGRDFERITFTAYDGWELGDELRCHVHTDDERGSRFKVIEKMNRLARIALGTPVQCKGCGTNLGMFPCECCHWRFIDNRRIEQGLEPLVERKWPGVKGMYDDR